MDKNKLKKLHKMVYKISPNCGLCKHGQFFGYGTFGSCAINTYDHGKHTATRFVSIRRDGHCPQFEVEPKNIELLDAWKEFYTGYVK